jgi:uncharacterized protein
MNQKMKTNEMIAMAAYNGNANKLKVLLAKNINPNTRFRRNTLLHWAVQEGKLSTCRLLMSYNAKLEIKNELGETPIFNAIEHPAVLSLMIKNGAKVNVYRIGKDTPLHLACAFGYKKTVEILLKNGADTWAKDGNNRTPMYWAGVYRQKGIKELIRKKRLKMNEKTKNR